MANVKISDLPLASVVNDTDSAVIDQSGTTKIAARSVFLAGYVTETGTQTLTNKTLSSPTLVTPVLGTPSSGDLSSCSGNLSNCTADGTNKLGYLNIPQRSQSADYTLVLADAGLHILHPSADTTPRTFTIPSNASVPFSIGTAVTFVNQNGAGNVSIAITSDTLRFAGSGATGTRTLTANGIATALKITSTEWIISGTNLA